MGTNEKRTNENRTNQEHGVKGMRKNVKGNLDQSSKVHLMSPAF